MAEEGKGAEQVEGGEEEDVIPSSQGEMFSSQSSTPDLLSSSHLIPILQPSQSASGAESDMLLQPRAGELLGSTPTKSEPGVSVSSAEVRLDRSATPSEVCLDVSDTPCEARLDLSDTPSGSAGLKRPLSDSPAATPPDKRRRSVVSADDSDVQFVEEVGPDVQVVYCSEEPGSAAEIVPADSAAAESQVGFHLRLSPTQSEEVSPVVPQVPPAATEIGEASELATEPATASAKDLAGGPAANAATDTPADPAAPSAGPSAEPPAKESQPADEPADSSGSQGFQPPAESESTEVRLPHIQTPQVASSGDSASPPGGDTVFGHAQRLIEEQNRRQELQDRQPSSSSPRPEVQPVTVDMEEPTSLKESASITLEEDESAPTTRHEKEPVSVTLEDEESAPATGQAETPASVMLDSDKPAPVAGQKKPAPASGQGEQAPASEASVTEGEGLATRPAEEAKDATPPLTQKEKEEGQGGEAGSQLDSQTPGMSLLADWRSVMKSPGRSTETADDRPERTADRDPEAAGPATEAEEQAKLKTGEGAKAKVEEEAKNKLEEEAKTKENTDEEVQVAVKAKADVSAGEKMPTSVRWSEAEAMEVEDTPEELCENPLPGESATEDPYRFHGTQSQETQPSRLRPALKRPKVPNKSTSTAVSTSPAGDAASASLLKLMANLSTEAKKLTSDGYGLVEMSLTWRKAGDDKDVVKAFSLDEHDSAALLRRITSSSFSSSGSSQLSTSTAGGYAGDVSSKSSSGSGSGSVNKRQSTLSSVTLSTIEGRGARHSISSSVDALPAPGRRSIVSVQSSPGSDDGVQEVSASPPRRVVPKFLSPDGRPPRPHGQPAAVSSLRSGLDDPSWPASQLPPGLASPPAATSTQAERSSGDERPAAAAGRLPASQGSGSGASHVTGSTPSPEIVLQPPLSVGPATRPLTDREEDELSEQEQSGLAQRILKPDTPCFALWGADQTYYPGRLVSEGRADRWLVRFDDGTTRQVPTDHILPVVNLWKGISVFVRVSHQNIYESGIITGHRMTSGADAVEYIISLDSQREVQSAVPRSWLSLTRDQAAVIKEKRQPSLGQLAVGSPTRHLSLDNLVTGRRRAAGASGGRRLANFETSCSDSAADASMEGSSGTRRAGSAPAASRRKGAKGKAQPASSKSKTTEPAKETVPASSTSAKETTSPTGGRGRRSAPERRSRSKKAAISPATPDKPTSAPAGAREEDSASGGRSRRGSRPKRSSTPTAAGATTADSAAATPSGRGKKRVTTSTPTDEAAATAATPGGRRSKRGGDTPAAKASVPASTPVSRSGRKRAAPTSPSSPEPQPTPSRRARVRSTAGSAQKRPEPATPAPGRRARKRLALAPAAEEEEEAEEADPPAGQEERTSTDDTSPDKAAPILSLGEVPSTKSKLFAKHTFILTCVDPSSAAAHPKKGRRKISPLFDKRHVIQHIEARGGHVLHEPTLTPTAVQRIRSQGDLLLISNGALRTAKYISCLAMGVPCVGFSWLATSIRLAQCQPYEDYLLPAGYDAETGKVVEQLLGATPPPLARLRVLLAAEPDSEWGQVMAQVLAAAGATVKLDRQDPAAAKLPVAMDVVVAEADCPPAVLAWADGCSVPVVSGEWAIGSVMAHRKLAFDAREEFDYRFRRYPGVG